MRACLLAALFLVAACDGRGSESPNVLLIVVDTLRGDRVSYAGYERETTPRIDRLAARSIVFTSAQTPRAKTNPAMVSLMTGLYPHEHGVRDLSTPLHPTIPTLAESLQAAGYRNTAIVGNYVLQKYWSGLARGFDHWVEDFPQSTGVPPDDVPQRIAESVTNGALTAFGLRAPTENEGPDRAVLAGASPWFLYLHYMDPHGAYDAPIEVPFRASRVEPLPPDGNPPAHAFLKPYVAEYNVPSECRLPDGRIDANAVRDRYEAEVHYADREIGRLLDALEEEGLLDNTIVVFTADHGESLGEHRYFFEHGRYAYEATCHVPLFLHVPGASPRSTDANVSLCDLAPTLLELCGLPGLEQSADVRQVTRGLGSTLRGASIAGQLENASDELLERPVFCEKIAGDEREKTVQIKAVRIGRWKLLRRYAHRVARSPELAESARGMRILSEELYDVRADPAETRNLINVGRTGAPLERLSAELDRFLEAEAGFAELADELAERRSELLREDPERAARIKALGY